MKIINPQLSGSVYASGSFVLPSGTANQRPSNPASGSLFFEISDSGSVLTIYNGSGSNGWETVGKQTTPYNPPAQADIEYLVVAGGGGAGGWGGGGGAGGLLSSSLSSVTSGSSFTVTVGAGGSRGVYGSNYTGGSDGVDSSIAGATISTITSTGGGGGGYYNGFDGRDGGSGGGGGIANTTSTQTGGSATSGQGFAGGTGGGNSTNSPYSGGGGGGGAGEVGGNGLNSGTYLGGDGGDGKQSNITGTSTYYAGGGGGHTDGRTVNTTTVSQGGQGGGGDGGNYYIYNQVNAADTRSSGDDGTANTGGGGGSAYSYDSNSINGNGGSGVVILAYDSGSINGAGGIVGDAGNGRKYHQFNSTDTFKVGSTSDFQIHTTNLVMHVDAGQYASRSGSAGLKDLSTYDNSPNMQSGGSLSSNYWWEGDGTNALADFERNGGSMTSDVAHTGYGSFTGRTNVGWCIEFWIKSTASGGHSTQGKTIIGRNSSDLYGSISIFSNKLAWIHYDGSWSQEQSTTSINDGSWHHCVLNNNSDETIDIWVDGTKENDGAASAINPDTRFFKMDSLGRGYSGQNTDMDIGQIRVYDATLTDAQILQNYNATKTNFV